MRKKLFAILMSAMMMVTFMPAMAFAETTPGVTGVDKYTGNLYDKYEVTLTQGTVTDTVIVDTVRTFEDGKIVVSANAAKAAVENELAINSTKHPLYSLTGDWEAAMDATGPNYYDFAGASLTRDTAGNGMYQSLTRAQIGSALFDGTTVKTLATWGIKVVAPSYASNYVAASPATKVLDGTHFGSLSLKGYDADNAEAQDCTLEASFTAASCDAVRNNAGLTAAVKVGADTTPATAQAAVFYVDKFTSEENFTSADPGTLAAPKAVKKDYDGAAHKLVLKAGTGVAATYAKYNAKTTGWDPVDEIAWKDADATGTLYKAVVTDTVETTTDVTYYFNVTVDKAAITFNVSGNAKVLYTGDTCDAFDFVVLSGTATADAKAAVADKEAIVNFLKNYYNAKATETTTGYNIALSAKTLTAAEQKAYDAAVAKANWDLTVGDLTASVAVVRNTKVNDITVTSLNKTIHVKKAKATKKAYTKTVKAETLAGTAKFKKVSGNSKITVASDGKITIKKGLKKGTYKVKVKAYVPEGLGYLYASTTEVVKVKVVK